LGDRQRPRPELAHERLLGLLAQLFGGTGQRIGRARRRLARAAGPFAAGPGSVVTLDRLGMRPERTQPRPRRLTRIPGGDGTPGVGNTFGVGSTGRGTARRGAPRRMPLTRLAEERDDRG